MLEWLFGRKKRPRTRPAGVPPGVPDEVVDAVALVMAYWSFDAGEQAALLARGAEALPWRELLRLHHLNCLEALGTPSLRQPLELNEVPPPLDEESGAALGRCRESAERLLLPDSPYRPREADVWQGELDPEGRTPPTMRGVLCNPSLTHLGSLEVLRLGEGQRPKELAFVPFDDLQTVAVAGKGAFRAARLFYDDGRPDEIVLLPILYATSWRAASPYLRDGRMTQFIGNPPGEGPAAEFGLGVGQQDFSARAGGGRRLFGLGSVAQVTFALDPADPRFALRCRARGLDPDEVLPLVGPEES
jgi:hypothetical protein